MITPYFGEFLIIPMPLELSLERCSNTCHYCFSNLNGYNLKTSYNSILNQIKNLSSRKNHASKLLKLGYPICFSNRSDPFCESNYKFAVKFCEICRQMDIDIAYQTKGGKGIDDVLEFLKPSCWYITIAQDDENLRQQLEPGAPPIAERFKLIEKLVGNGHTVSVGINPYVPEWIKDKKAIVKKIKDAGAYGILCEGFHLSREQARRINKSAIGETIINRGLKGNADDFELKHYHELRDIVLESGLEFWSFWNEHVSEFWKPYREHYHCFPTITDFINYCIENLRDGDIVDFDTFSEIMLGLPKNEFKIDSYIISINRSFRSKKIPSKGTAIQLLKFFWGHPQLKTCPANHPRLSIVAEKQKNSDILVIEGKLPVLMYRKAGFSSIFVNKYGEAIS